MMNTTDWIGTVGVATLLLAFTLNLTKRIAQDDWVYILLNMVGAALAGLASILLHYVPFIVLEAVWVVVSIWAIIQKLSSKKTA